MKPTKVKTFDAVKMQRDNKQKRPLQSFDIQRSAIFGVASPGLNFIITY